MNLLPPEPGRRRRRRGRGHGGRTFPPLGGVLVLAAMAVAGLQWRALSSEVASLEAGLAALDQEVAGLEARRAEATAAREELERLSAVGARFARFEEDRLVMPDLLRGLSERIPDEAVLEEVRREGSEVWISGRATTTDAAAAAAARLAAVGRLRFLELLWVEQGVPAAGGAQRFALGGGVRFETPEPEPFGISADGGRP